MSRARATKTAPATNPAMPIGRLLEVPRRIVRRSAMIPPRSEPASSPSTRTPPASVPAVPVPRPKRRLRQGGNQNAAPPSPKNSAASAFLLEIVAQQRRAGGIITRFSDAEHRSRDEELRVAARQAGEESRQAPDGDADADYRLPDAPVSPDAKGNRRHRIDQQEGAAQQADLAVTQMEFGLDPGGNRRQDVAIEVIQEVDADHHGEDVSRVAPRHRRALCSAAPPLRP